MQQKTYFCQRPGSSLCVRGIFHTDFCKDSKSTLSHAHTCIWEFENLDCFNQLPKKKPPERHNTGSTKVHYLQKSITRWSAICNQMEMRMISVESVIKPELTREWKVWIKYIRPLSPAHTYFPIPSVGQGWLVLLKGILYVIHVNSVCTICQLIPQMLQAIYECLQSEYRKGV